MGFLEKFGVVCVYYAFLTALLVLGISAINLAWRIAEACHVVPVIQVRVVQ